VDPQAHNARLSLLEEQIVKSSELFRCGGSYPTSDTKVTPLADRERPHSSAPEFNDTDLMQSQRPLWHLFEGHRILLQVLKNFDNLISEGFCSSFFSIIAQYREASIAQIVKIPRKIVSDIVEAFKLAIDQFNYGEDNKEKTVKLLISSMSGPLEVFFWPHSLFSNGRGGDGK
jgi:hypothetical protein